MALKFFNIGKANARIEELESELARLRTVTPEEQQKLSDVLMANDALSKQAEQAEADLATARASIHSLTEENQNLKAELTKATSAVNTLTAENGDLRVRLECAISQYNERGKTIAAINSELSKICLAAGCLQTKDAAEADLITIPDKLKAYQGAVNTALSRLGVNTDTIPAGNKNAPTLGQSALVAKLESIKDPVERAKFFAANRAALFAAAKGN